MSTTPLVANLLKNLTPLPLSDAAWLAGVAQETLERFLKEDGHKDLKEVNLETLLQSAFHLLGYRQTQVTMLGRQLSMALQREKELIEALEMRLQDTFSLETDSSKPEVSLPEVKPLEKKKKGGKKRKKEILFP